MTSHAELAKRYKRLRAVAFELNKHLPESASKHMIEHAASKLGLWHSGMLVFGEQDELSVLMDYVIYDCHEDGANAVDRYIAQHPPVPGSEEDAVLQAEQQAFYAVVQVEEVLEGFGVRVHDLLSDRHFLLADISFSKTAVEGVVLATRLVPFDDFVMTSGAPLPLEEDAFIEVANHVSARNLHDPEAFARLSRQERADVTADIIRLALQADACSAVQYADVDEAGTYAPTASIVRASPRIGRNDPCPCGSGKKYKKCCGRLATA